MKMINNITKTMLIVLATSGLLQALPALNPMVVNKSNEKVFAVIVYNDQEDKLASQLADYKVVTIEPGAMQKVTNLSSKSGFDRDLVIGFVSNGGATLQQYLNGRIDVDSNAFNKLLSLINVGTTKLISKVTVEGKDPQHGDPIISVG